MVNCLLQNRFSSLPHDDKITTIKKKKKKVQTHQAIGVFTPVCAFSVDGKHRRCFIPDWLHMFD